jgi:hypothetical protein
MSYKIIDLPALGRPFNTTDIIEVSANGTGSYKANIGNFTLGGTNYIFVNANGTPAQNGAAVKSAYTAAQAMTPNGSAISAINRIVILLAPGYYSFNEAVDGPFTVDQSFIDLESLSGNTDVYFSSIQVYAGTLIFGLDVRLVGIDTTKNNYYTHGAFAIASIGDAGSENIIAKNCVGGDYSFSSFSKGFYGIYDNCVGGNYSFCSTGDGTAPAGITSIATGNFLSYGTIKNCTAGLLSFVAGINSVSVPAGTITNYGLIENCTAVGNSFCYSEFRAQNAGTIKNCNSGGDSFVVTNDAINTGMASNTGAIMNCIVGGSGICLYGGASISPTASYNLGMISSCSAYGSSPTYAFATSVGYNGNNAGVILNCYVDGSGFCGPDGINAGYIIECSAMDSSFCSGSPSSNSGQILRCTLIDWVFTVGAPTFPGRVVLGIDTTGVVNF